MFTRLIEGWTSYLTSTLPDLVVAFLAISVPATVVVAAVYMLKRAITRAVEVLHMDEFERSGRGDGEEDSRGYYWTYDDSLDQRVWMRRRKGNRELVAFAGQGGPPARKSRRRRRAGRY